MVKEERIAVGGVSSMAELSHIKVYFIGGFSWADSTAFFTHLGRLACSSEKLDDAMLRGV